MTATGNAVWSSRFAFIMASVGFAVGLGNIWRFPYVTGENGGSAFVVIYLLCAVAIGIPCLMAELLVGRRGGGSPGANGTAAAGEVTLTTSSAKTRRSCRSRMLPARPPPAIATRIGGMRQVVRGRGYAR